MLEFLTFHEWCAYKAYKGNALQEDMFSGYYDYAFSFVRTVVGNFNDKYPCDVGKDFTAFKDPEMDLFGRIFVVMSADDAVGLVSNEMFKKNPDWSYWHTRETGSGRCMLLFKPDHLMAMWSTLYKLKRVPDDSGAEVRFHLFGIFSRDILKDYHLVIQRYGISA